LRLRALAAGIALLVLPGAGSSAKADALRSIAATYYAQAGRIATITGRDTTMDYYQRLLDDADLFSQPSPSDYPAALWQPLLESFADLDTSLATQLIGDSFRPMSSIRGLGETLVRSSKDGTMQPVAVYVPASYSPLRPAPLVVFLHGRSGAESHLLALQFVSDLAERTGTIVVAPYGRGSYDFHGAESDVYDALDEASRSFAVDAHKRYLAGYSMGGFSAFRIAPIRPEDWSAVMCIAGSLLNSRAGQIVTAMPNARFYVLTGAKDAIVPTLYPIVTAIFLRDSGLAVTFYSDPNGTHELYSLRAILSQAWDDMERGIVRLPTGLSGSANLPDNAQ